jgi:hypothetical protein
MARVRLREAPSGSATSAKKAPWSSCGRKPVGVRDPAPTMPAMTAASSSSETKATRTSRATAAP